MKHIFTATVMVEHKPGCMAQAVAVSLSTMPVQAGDLPPQSVVEAICLGCGPVDIRAISTEYTTAKVSHE